MSLGKTYYRYVQRSTCGVVASPGVNVLYDNTGTLALTGALEQSLAWNIRTGERIHMCRPTSTSTRGHAIPGTQVTVQALSPSPTQSNRLAVGYEDGGVRIYELQSQGISAVSGECRQVAHFPGHRAAVQSLAYDKAGALLASGGSDCDIVVWDLTAETGLFRLRGHRDAITQLRFIGGGGLVGGAVGGSGDEELKLLSGSKDTLLKVWDLEQQRCIETVVGHRAEVWGFAVTPDETRVVTISSAADLKVWALNVKGRGSGMEVDDADKEEGSGSGGNSAPTQGHLALMGPIRRVGMERGVAVQFSRNGMFMGCHGTGKVLEIYKRRSHEEVLKKIKRRLKRLREKKRKKNLGQGQDEGEQEGEEEDASLAQATTADEFALLGTIRSGSKIQAFDFAPAVANADTCKVLVSSMNNTLQEYVMDLSSKLTKKGALVVVFFCNLLRRQGHRLCWVWSFWVELTCIFCLPLR